MIKVINESKNKEISYPRLGVCTTHLSYPEKGPLIVLFSDRNSGMVIDKGGSEWGNGVYEHGWEPEMFKFYDYAKIIY